MTAKDTPAHSQKGKRIGLNGHVSEFDDATQVAPDGSAMILNGWDISGNANGGYLMAMAGRAMRSDSSPARVRSGTSSIGRQRARSLRYAARTSGGCGSTRR